MVDEPMAPAYRARGRVPSFAGIRTFLRLPHVSDHEQLPEYDFAVLGLPFDTGVTYRPGCRFGPAAIREISTLIRIHNPVIGVSYSDHIRGADIGDSPTVPGNTPASLSLMEETLDSVLKQDVVPFCLGGDHTISLAVLRSLAKKHGPLGLVHFDSHPDTWCSMYGEPFNHATPFRRAVEEGLILPERSIQLGIRGSLSGADDLAVTREMGFTVVEAHELLQMDVAEVSKLVTDTVGDSTFHLTFDIDFLDPAYAPGTGTPEIGGPSTAQALSYVRRLDVSRMVGMDLVEVLPACDVAQITALAAANIMFEVIGLVARCRAS